MIRSPRVLGVLVVLAGTARADVSLDEFGVGQKLRPAEQLALAACDVDVELRGTVAEVELRQRIVNVGPAMAAALEVELPTDAQLIGAAAIVDRGPRVAAIPVTARFDSEHVVSDDVLGTDPALVTSLGFTNGDRKRYRVVTQPIDTDHELAIVTRWTAIAAVRNSAVRLVLPGRAPTARLAPCRGNVHATPGPGASIQRIRIDGVTAGTRDTAPFVVEADDVTLEAELAFAKPQPLVWTQTEALGEGWTARAVAVIAPPVPLDVIEARRALIVVDSSRSMQLLGRHPVDVVHAIGAALPKGTEIEGILYDRVPRRVFGTWQPANVTSLDALESAIVKQPAVNGSDAAAALALAHDLVVADATRGQTMVIVVTDGVFGGIPDSALAHAMQAHAAELDVHAIVLDPGHLTSPNAVALRAPVDLYGGTYVEVRADELAGALAGVDAWLRPSWLGLQLHGIDATIPDLLLAGSGVTVLGLTRTPTATITLSGHGDPAFTVAARAVPATPVAARAVPATPVAQLVLAGTSEGQLVHPHTNDPTPGELVTAAHTLVRLRAAHPTVDADHALAVLASVGKVAKTRRAMVAGGGPYTRMVAIDDPPLPLDMHPAQSWTMTASMIDKVVLERLFRDQLKPYAFACYQRALGKAPSLGGQVTFTLDIGRGEVTRASVNGLGNEAFDACLVDAAYSLTLALPNADVDGDDRTIAHYPLTFSVHDRRPTVFAGDADSDSPLDIDAIVGGVPRHVPKPETATPLGNLRP
jgi:hypothetical protein